MTVTKVVSASRSRGRGFSFLTFPTPFLFLFVAFSTTVYHKVQDMLCTEHSATESSVYVIRETLATTPNSHQLQCWEHHCPKQAIRISEMK
ncbi:hypothetical protein SODALDRAFT_48426 [Sodiomyces alkalinus F11]|uniref:Uncharacterized protein n=1 Tax=Sodiomyces alkalinus (strain CBS 110278 / VKM F-3762 / F11) TaxID=1314773 RepID=A0A3N2QAP8_SODAK|nr:hypothetical protein SODALDRAFT_48426 [Sodiomyces alkalinus F11]ROT43831.1 hypothetical protein SODALDRAFT_48426 [Sodiomyces alkalinus F11]